MGEDARLDHGGEDLATGPGASGQSSYFFTLNIFMLPCRLVAPAHIAERATQK